MKKLFFQIILPVFAIAGILGFITVFNPIKQENAAWQVNQTQTYSCGQFLKVQLIPYAAPACDSNGYNSNLTSYQTTVQIKAENDTSFHSQGQYTVHWKWASFWCSTEDPHAPCIANNASATAESNGNDGLTGDNSAFVTAQSHNIQSTGQFAGLACGYYQTDFAFYVTDNHNPSQRLCGISIDNPASLNQNASWCHTGTTCTIPTATPTITPTASPAPSICPQLLCAYHPGCQWVGRTQCSCGQLVCQPTVTPTVTPTEDCDGDFDSSDPSVDCPNPTATATPTQPTNGGNNNCTGDSCNNTNNNNNNNSQSQSQSQDNNQTVNITLGNGQQQQQQQVLGSSTAPSQLPSTGAESDVLFGLLGLIPVGWKIRKLI